MIPYQALLTDFASSADMKYRNIVSDRYLDENRIVCALRRVVFAKLGAKTPGLTANDRIDLRIIVGGSSEYIDPYSGLLQMVGFAPQRRRNDKVQKLRQPVAAAHRAAAANAVDCVPDICGANSVGWTVGILRLSPPKFSCAC